ncbi:MAG: hypothetical protein GX876_10010 [Bacteroidales bacterium]|nr:hypothetical protein [Bacteroidales bacterium]
MINKINEDNNRIKWRSTWGASILILLITFGFQTKIYAQKPSIPIPIEIFAGNNELYYQMVIKRSFAPQSKFNIFGLATYSAKYKNDISKNRAIIINQISYSLGKGFGVMSGIDYNSFSGFTPIIGPQHNFANKKILAITVSSISLNKSSDLKLLGLYEYKPQINENLGFYSRLQFIYNHSLKENNHKVSYIYLRAGLKRKSFIFGLAANVDWSGPKKYFSENYGGFVRWEFE